MLLGAAHCVYVRLVFVLRQSQAALRSFIVGETATGRRSPSVLSSCRPTAAAMTSGNLGSGFPALILLCKLQYVHTLLVIMS